MAATDALLELDAAVFIDDMLDYVYQRYEISSISLLPIEERNIYRRDAEYAFSPEIGDALLHVLRAFFNIAENIVQYSIFFPMHVPNRNSSIANFIRCHFAASLTDRDFVMRPTMWCSALLNYLVIVTSLCIYFEEQRDPLTVIYIKIAASEVITRIMDGPTLWKIDKFKRYARRYPSRTPLAQTYMYILD